MSNKQKSATTNHIKTEPIPNDQQKKEIEFDPKLTEKQQQNEQSNSKIPLSNLSPPLNTHDENNANENENILDS